MYEKRFFKFSLEREVEIRFLDTDSCACNRTQMNVQMCKRANTKSLCYASTATPHHGNAHTHKHTKTRQNIDKERHTQLPIVLRFTQAHVGPLHGSSGTQEDPWDTCFHCSSSPSHERRPRVLPEVLQGGHPHQESGDVVQDLS